MVLLLAETGKAASGAELVVEDHKFSFGVGVSANRDPKSSG